MLRCPAPPHVRWINRIMFAGAAALKRRRFRQEETGGGPEVRHSDLVQLVHYSTMFTTLACRLVLWV